MERLLRVCIFLGLAAVLLQGAGCSGKKDTERPPNLILVTFDALRADHLGCYGYNRNTSPNLDAFARTGTFYARAVATSPWTLPTHASLFTGKYPFEHGAHGFRENPENAPNTYRLALEEYTLTEALQDRGYQTAAFVANPAFLSRWVRLNQGFKTYQIEHVDGDVLNERVFTWLQEAFREPFFLFINYMDTHFPYNTKPVPGLAEWTSDPDCAKVMELLTAEVMPATGPLPGELIKTGIDQYDTGIANVDRAWGALLERLKQLELDANTIIVLTSDHGEYFGEHHLVQHSKDVYQPVLWVPLLIRHPGRRQGQRVERPFSLAEVPALVLSRLFPQEQAFLQELFPTRPGRDPVLSELYYTRKKDLYHPVWGPRFDRIRTAIFDGPYKYIHSTDGKHELYNLKDDPDEQRNLVDAEEVLAEGLEKQLMAFKASRQTPQVDQPPPLPDPAELQKMKDLGYLK